MDDHQLQLQIPHFVYDTAPTLVPGGGAEVVPGANSSWFIRNGFTPTLIDNHFFSSQPPHEDDQPHESSSGPFDFSLPPAHTYEATAQQRLPTPDLSVFLADPPPSLIAPSPLGLPIYSASGFDLLSILARVSTRPYPRVVLGPVDATCSFVVVDVRRFDHPIVYCSPSFCTLTGYSEQEVLGRNCRFLQAPAGEVRKGEPRQYTSQDAVNHLRKSLMADKECQSSILNYKKNGAAFINLVTVIPVPGGVSGDDQEIAYHVGFQVDLTEQPNAILEKLRDGSYLVNYAGQSDLAPFGLTGQGIQRHIQSASQHLSPSNARDRKTNAIPPIVMSKDLKRLLADPAFIRSLPITPSAAAPAPAAAASSTLVDDSLATGVNQPLHMLLLEASPDFIHVVSLKGSFLYVAPSVRRVLGYESEEMIGTSIADYAHPEDVIPLMRELKESSATGPTANSGEATTFSAQQAMPRNVDLLFRARTKMGRYVWVECRGRLHVEPGKGRKAIVLSGRAREMMNLRWEDVNRAGGLACGVRLQQPTDNTDKPVYQLVEQEVWGLLGGACKETATFLSVGRGMEDVLGWTADEMLGTRLADVVCDEAARDVLGDVVSAMRHCQQQYRLPKRKEHTRTDGTRVKKIACKLRRKGGGVADVWVVVYRADAEGDEEEQKSVDVERGAALSISPAALVYQIRLASAETISCGTEGGSIQALQTPPSSSTSSSSLAGAVSLPSNTPTSSSSTTSASQLVDMFEELSVSRGSSWQYELQQLRITNLKLQEELVELEVAEAALQSQQQQLADQLSSPTYDAPQSGLFDTPVYPDVPSHQLFIASPLRQMGRCNSHQIHFDSQQRQKQQMLPSDQALLHHPQPVQQHYAPMHNMHCSPPPPPSSNSNSTSALPPPQLTAERALAPAPVGREQQQQRVLHPRPAQKQASPMTWGPMVPPSTVGVYVNPGSAYMPSAGSSLKRSWSNIDRQ